ncbi:MAG: class I SAM-dependent methyltransferase [Spirochaetes bacterium]|jgi:ubiquinone/menaquinone biosynthesis C-methylase UbiE|nr:class I SAM-dependent methyltransferase [Spirochaetota bacterium]
MTIKNHPYEKFIGIKVIGIGMAVFVVLTAALSMILFKERVKAWFYLDHMEREERLGRMETERMIEELHIVPGMTVADIGAGSGLFTRRIAQRVTPGGIVYAVDINSVLLRHIAKTCDPDIVQTVSAEEMDPKIPAPVDLIFICDTLHYIPDPARYVQKMSSYLKRGGRIAVVDFITNWPPAAVKFTPGELTEWMKPAGLKKSEYHDFIKDEFLMVFIKE